MNAESIEVEPSNISFSIENQYSEFNVQNLTLHYIAIKIISPNSDLIKINPSESIKQFLRQALIDPCSQLTIQVKLNILTSSNLHSFQHNNSLTILTHDIEDYDEDNPISVQWDQLYKEDLAKHTVSIKFLELDNTVYSVKPIKAELNQIVIVKKIKDQDLITEDQRKLIFSYFFTNISPTDQYRTTKEFIMFFIPTLNDGDNNFENDVIILGDKNGNVPLIIKIFIPQTLIHKLPKYPQEQTSPQAYKSKKQMMQIDCAILHKSQSNIQEQERLSPSKSTEINQGIPFFSSPHEILEEKKYFLIFNKSELQSSTINDDQVSPINIERSQRKYQTEIIDSQKLADIKEQGIQINKSWNNFQSVDKQENISPLIVYEKEKSIQDIQPNFNNHLMKEISSFRTYSKIKTVLLLNHSNKLIIVSEKDIMQVWDIQMNSEVGQIADHEKLKNGSILFLKEWRYYDQFADEITDREHLPNIIFQFNESDQRVLTIGSDSVLRIFNINLMKFEVSIKLGLKFVTASTFLTDKALFGIGGRQESEFSILSLSTKKPKQRNIKFFRMDTLIEYQSFKLQSEEDDTLTNLEYADNGNRKHSRLNHVLAVSICSNDGIGKLFFLFLDRMNQCTILMTLNQEQLQIKGISSIKYIQETGRFAVVEAKKKKEIQVCKLKICKKVVLVNIKQVKTESGFCNGIECKQIDQKYVDSQLTLQVMSDPQYMFMAQQNMLSLYDLNTQQHRQTIKFEDKIDSFYIINNKAAIILTETIKILDV